MTGRIVELEGSHFELADDAGKRQTFGVAIDAVVDSADLPRFKSEGTRVVVVYEEDAPGLRVAHRVYCVDAPQYPYFLSHKGRGIGPRHRAG
jgi:hypothetical protein